MSYCIIPDNTRKMLLLHKMNSGWELPKIKLYKQKVKFFPAYVPFITKEICIKYGIDGIVLRHIREVDNIHVCEIDTYSTKDYLHKSYYWISFIDIENLKFRDQDQKQIIINWINDFKSGTLPENRAPWEIKGWFYEADKWIREHLTDLNYKIVYPNEQIKGAWSWSAIIRISTDNEKLYFKADYTKAPYETKIIKELSNYFPNKIPNIIVADYIKNWMIMKDFGDRYLDKLNLKHYLDAVKEFAEIQIKSINEIERFKKLECRDMSPQALISYYKQLIKDKEILLNGPHSLSVVEVSELEELLPILEKKCDKVASSSIQYTINNEDFKAQNVVLFNDNYIFFDWSNTVISHPFFSINYFLNRMSVPKGYDKVEWKVILNDKKRCLIRDAYLKTWSKFDKYENLLLVFNDVRNLFFLYEAIRCYTELPFLEIDCPWYENTKNVIPRFLRNLILAERNKNL